MSIGPYILLVPDIALEKIFSFLSYDEIARNREACLSVDNVQKVMIIGQAKDFGTCRSVRKDGSPCTSFVNVNKCEFCVYHVRQEYQKCSKRSELQSTFSGRGLTALQNKVLGKNEVFYAGKSFVATPATRSRKLRAKDESRMSLLSNNIPNAKNVSNSGVKEKRQTPVQHVEVSASRRLKDLELLKKLGGKSTEVDSSAESASSIATSTEVTLKESKSAALSVIAKLKAKQAVSGAKVLDPNNLSDIGVSEQNTTKITPKSDPVQPPKPQILPTTSATPKLGAGFDIPILSGIGNKLVNLSSPITKKHINRANLNALNWVQRNGPIQKENPNKTTPKGGKKRVLEALEKQNPKRQKIQENDHFSQRFKQMMAATSKHTDLLEERDNEEVEKYFNKLEMKEKMEEKMMGTYKVACKAVRCLQCKYTSFSAADRCKEERHPLKVYDAMKRFFKCGDCGNRTVSLDVIPTLSCKKCGGGKWERAGMMKEKIVVPKSALSIRGGEQEHVNSNITNANINLLVPDD